MTDNDWFFFEADEWLDKAASLHEQYTGAEPFPHILFDDFLPEAVTTRLMSSFPSVNYEGFKQHDNDYQKNKQGRVQENYFRGVDHFVRHMLNEFNGMVFLDFLERLTGIKGLIGDPHFFGGAMHQILPGGKLDVHADFNYDARRDLDRRINVLLYLNQPWQEDWGGHLELWDKDMSKCHLRAAPLFNRCVIFNTNSSSFHGHPDPLTCPDGVTRKSIALYYYTVGRDDEPEGMHRTRSIWKKRPQDIEP
ncbi:MAG: 2OG-Fe(II) oxygenase [Pseudomonadales bacterium]|nr:2OG-Fe(II) oxygenase [Pseudomonadales bacterium]